VNSEQGCPTRQRSQAFSLETQEAASIICTRPPTYQPGTPPSARC